MQKMNEPEPELQGTFFLLFLGPLTQAKRFFNKILAVVSGFIVNVFSFSSHAKSRILANNTTYCMTVGKKQRENFQRNW